MNVSLNNSDQHTLGKSRILNKHAIFVIVIALSCTIFFYKYIKPRPYVIILRSTRNDIRCYNEVYADALPSAEAKVFVPPDDSIFFLETSCKGGLNSKQACGLESASRAHPERQVYVLFSGPVTNYTLQHSILAKLKYLPNINYARIHTEEFARGTPLESLVTSRTVNKNSFYPVEHTADILRILTLYKWSGIYLDFDILVVKSLNPLGSSWIASEDSSTVSTAAMALSNDELAVGISDEFVREMVASYAPHSWNGNGPGVVTRVLSRRCNTPDISLWSAYRCGGFPVYEARYIYPVHYQNYDWYFKPESAEMIKNNSLQAFTHHLWNRLNQDAVIEENSAYDILAKELCPIVHETYGDLFGL